MGKDHAIIAQAIRRTGRPQCNGGQSLPAELVAHTERVVQHIADELGRAHPRTFEKTRFLTMCGFPPSYTAGR